MSAANRFNFLPATESTGQNRREERNRKRREFRRSGAEPDSPTTFRMPTI